MLILYCSSIVHEMIEIVSPISSAYCVECFSPETIFSQNGLKGLLRGVPWKFSTIYHRVGCAHLCIWKVAIVEDHLNH